MNGPNKLVFIQSEPLHYSIIKLSGYLNNSLASKKIEYAEYCPQACIHNTLFSY